MENQARSYEDMTVKELIVIINIKDKELYELESDIDEKENETTKLENKISELEDKIEVFEDLKVSGEIIKQIDILTTDEVAKIYYAIEESYHFQHLDKFKPL